jgi:tryptophanyl-tRNA synthetase
VTEEPDVIGRATVSLAAMFFAIGLDPDVATVFVAEPRARAQPARLDHGVHVSYGELSRMTQFKDKSDQARGHSSPRPVCSPIPRSRRPTSCCTTPTRYPVGDDQRQHVEITRDIAIRFNHRFGDTFVIPEAVTPAAGARVMSLQDPMLEDVEVGRRPTPDASTSSTSRRP